MKTTEQLEKQMSEEFEKWWNNPENNDWIYAEMASEVKETCFMLVKAAALPLMKKIEELEKARDYWKFQYDGENADYIKLQKENEELRATLKEAISLINEARWDNNDTPYPKHELIEWRTKFNLDKEGEK